MFVVARGGEIAVNIEKAEKVQLAYHPVRESYSIEAVLSSTGTTELDKYETFEYAQYAFYQMILSITKGDKVFFMPTEREIVKEISTESIREMMNKTPITVQKNEQG